MTGPVLSLVTLCVLGSALHFCSQNTTLIPTDTGSERTIPDRVNLMVILLLSIAIHNTYSQLILSCWASIIGVQGRWHLGLRTRSTVGRIRSHGSARSGNSPRSPSPSASVPSLTAVCCARRARDCRPRRRSAARSRSADRQRSRSSGRQVGRCCTRLLLTLPISPPRCSDRILKTSCLRSDTSTRAPTARPTFVGTRDSIRS